MDQQEQERSLMLRQIARLVSGAKHDGRTINVRQIATQVFVAYPRANLSITRIQAEILHAASEARVTVELEVDA